MKDHHSHVLTFAKVTEKNTWLNDDAQLGESGTFKLENDGLFLYLLFISHVILHKLFTQFQSFFSNAKHRMKWAECTIHGDQREENELQLMGSDPW